MQIETKRNETEQQQKRNGCWDMPISTNSNEMETQSNEMETKSNEIETRSS